MSVAVQDNEFFNKIKTGDWLVLFRVSTCYYCAQVADIIEKKILPKYDGLGFIEVDQQLNAETWANLLVSTAPTLMMFKNGEQVFDARDLKKQTDEQLDNRLTTCIDIANTANIDEAKDQISQALHEFSASQSPSNALQPNQTFTNDVDLREVTIPATITELQEHHFDTCLNLNTVTFVPDSKLTCIPAYAFYNCQSLESISLPASVSAIEDFAFAFCYGLSSVSIPNGCTLGDYAFYGCTNISKSALSNAETLKYGRKSMYE